MSAQRDGAAIAKALLIRNALREAAARQVSAQAQALLAVLVAESWPQGNAWQARLGLDLLAERLSASRASIQRWARDLEQAQLVRRKVGDGARVTRWTIASCRGSAGATPGIARALQGDRAHATRGVAPALPVSEAELHSGLTPPLARKAGQGEPGDEKPGASPQPSDALPQMSPLFEDLARSGSRAGRRALEQLAAAGDQRARQVLEEIAANA